MAKQPATTQAKVSGRITVAQLATEVASLRDEIAALRAEVRELRAAPPAAAPDANSTTPQGGPEVVVAPPQQPEHTQEQLIGAVLTEAFRLALEPIPDDPDAAEALFMSFCDLMHSERRGTPLLNQSLKNYTWRQFRANAMLYLNNEGAPGSFQVYKSVPEKVSKRDEKAKWFLRAKTRMPPPINFRRDDAANGQWRIESSSL